MYGQEDYGRSYHGPPGHGGGGGGYGGGYGGGGGGYGGGMRRDLDSVQLRRPDFSNLPVRMSHNALCMIHPPVILLGPMCCAGPAHSCSSCSVRTACECDGTPQWQEFRLAHTWDIPPDHALVWLSQTALREELLRGAPCRGGQEHGGGGRLPAGARDTRGGPERAQARLHLRRGLLPRCAPPHAQPPRSHQQLQFLFLLQADARREGKRSNGVFLRARMQSMCWRR